LRQSATSEEADDASLRHSATIVREIMQQRQSGGSLCSGIRECRLVVGRNLVLRRTAARGGRTHSRHHEARQTAQRLGAQPLKRQGGRHRRPEKGSADQIAPGAQPYYKRGNSHGRHHSAVETALRSCEKPRQRWDNPCTHHSVGTPDLARVPTSSPHATAHVSMRGFGAHMPANRNSAHRAPSSERLSSEKPAFWGAHEGLAHKP
jgi:hypothetical protein